MSTPNGKPLNEGAGARKTTSGAKAYNQGARKPAQRPHRSPKK